MRQRQKLIVIVGPTASGKSEFAVKIAQKYNGEIISADSRQVYRGLDIGTAKVKGMWHHVPFIPTKVGIQSTKIFVYKKIPHYCIDFFSPRKTYSAAKYQQCAKDIIRAIASRRKIPILVGGTGLWIDAVVYDWRLPSVAPNAALRIRLEKKNPAELLTILRKLDPRRAHTIEQKNPRRLIRAIEIARSLGSIPKLKKRARYNTLWIGLNPPLATLEKRIRNRAQKMIRDGIFIEAQNLLTRRISKKRIQEFGFEYRAALKYLSGALSKKEAREVLVKDTRAYARRQMMWFKRNPHIIWNPSAHELKKRLKAFLP